VACLLLKVFLQKRHLHPPQSRSSTYSSSHIDLDLPVGDDRGDLPLPKDEASIGGRDGTTMDGGRGESLLDL